MANSVRTKGEFNYIDEGSGEVMLLLHGLFGAMSNWEAVVDHFKSDYRVIIPILPIYTMPKKEAGVDGLTSFVRRFIEEMDLGKMIVMGNSLGGHLGLMLTLQAPEIVTKLVLTGSSGLFENQMGGSFPRRGSMDYVDERVRYTFYDPETVDEEFIKEIFAITSDIPKALRIVWMAKSAQRHNMADELTKINVPTLLIWGLNDTITPPVVAHEFNRLIKGSVLRFIDKCCHAPMMERPSQFNYILEDFLNSKEVLV